MQRSRRFPETRASLLASLRDDAGASSWREFFEHYAPSIYRVARQRGKSHPDAEDILQQVMLAVSEHIGGCHYDRDRGRFHQWVQRITDSKIKDHYRRSRPEIRSDEMVAEYADDRPSPADVWEQEWRLQDMLWCLDRIAEDISPRRMQAFRMYVLEGVPVAEIAQKLNMTPGHIYVTRYHLIAMLRERMARLEEGGRGDTGGRASPAGEDLGGAGG